MGRLLQETEIKHFY